MNATNKFGLLVPAVTPPLRPHPQPTSRSMGSDNLCGDRLWAHSAGSYAGSLTLQQLAIQCMFVSK